MGTGEGWKEDGPSEPLGLQKSEARGELGSAQQFFNSGNQCAGIPLVYHLADSVLLGFHFYLGCSVQCVYSMGAVGMTVLIACAASRPFMRGMAQSKMITSGHSSIALATASFPSTASPQISQPDLVSKDRSRRSTDSWSSAIGFGSTQVGLLKRDPPRRLVRVTWREPEKGHPTRKGISTTATLEIR